jgi:hypothetical protein
MRVWGYSKTPEPEHVVHVPATATTARARYGDDQVTLPPELTLELVAALAELVVPCVRETGA